MNEIQELNKFIDEITTVDGTDGKKYKRVKGKLVDDNGISYTVSNNIDDLLDMGEEYTYKEICDLGLYFYD